jgi:membrane protein DedA with SNARE-associated domain
MEEYARALADFVRDHSAWAAPIVLLLAFGESLAFISLLIPAWGALVAIGALIGASGISFWPVWIGGGIGALIGSASHTRNRSPRYGRCRAIQKSCRAGRRS